MAKTNKNDFEDNGMADTKTERAPSADATPVNSKDVKRIAELEAENAELLAIKVDQNNVISELKQKLASVELTAKVGKPTFQFDNKQYAFKIKNAFIMDGKRYTVEQALLDNSILEKIIKKKSGLVKEL